MGALALAAAGAAATITVQIKSTGFSPSAITINHGDRVIFKNVDKVDHQVVADDGSFASPILHAEPVVDDGRARTRPESFRYHDALYPRRTGKVTVKGPPPAVTLALSLPIVNYGTPITLSGVVSSTAPRTSRSRSPSSRGARPSPTQLAIVKTGARRRLLVRCDAVDLHDLRRALEQRRERQRRRAGRAEDPARSRAGRGT